MTRFVLISLIIALIIGTTWFAYKSYRNTAQINPGNVHIPLDSSNTGSGEFKTYVNKKYGYSFLYAPELILFTCGSNPHDFDGEEHIIISPFNSGSSSNVCIPLEGLAPVSIYTSQEENTSYSDIGSDPSYDTSTEIINIDGLSGIKTTKKLKSSYVDESGLLPSNIYETRVSRNGVTFYIVSSNEEYEQIYNQVLSSFTFSM